MGLLLTLILESFLVDVVIIDFICIRVDGAVFIVMLTSVHVAPCYSVDGCMDIAESASNMRLGRLGASAVVMTPIGVANRSQGDSTAGGRWLVALDTHLAGVAFAGAGVGGELKRVHADCSNPALG